VLLSAEKVAKAFGSFKAVAGADLHVEAGEIVGLIGPNGAGKSTFFNCIAGDLRPSEGRIVFDGVDVTNAPAETHARLGIGRTFQVPATFEDMTILENVRIAAQSRHHSWSLVRHHRAFVDVIDRARAVLDAVGLGDKEEELAANLSHGEQRHLEIGIALATEPKLLCLDEPTAGMSVSETRATVELIRQIATDLTILIVEHDMEVVMGLARTITVLHYGEVLAEGTPAEIQQNPRVQEVYLKT